MSAYGQYNIVEWRPTDKKPPKKLKLIDSCTYGELWECELVAKFYMEIELFGGKLYWFFYRSIKKWNAKLRHIANRGLNSKAIPAVNGVLVVMTSLFFIGNG